jgi:hypothetical protein
MCARVCGGTAAGSDASLEAALEDDIEPSDEPEMKPTTMAKPNKTSKRDLLAERMRKAQQGPRTK